VTAVADQSPTVRSPVPRFDESGARHKVQAAEGASNTRNPARVVVGAYTADSVWCNRTEFLHGHDEIVALLTRKWQHTLPLQ
jgi:nuclear transport factor 2 (NTF2) superfamily protein